MPHPLNPLSLIFSDKILFDSSSTVDIFIFVSRQRKPIGEKRLRTWPSKATLFVSK